MKSLPASFFLALSLVFTPFAAFSDSHAGEISGSGAGQEVDTQKPHISMNIGVEISGLERAAEDAAEGINLIGESLQKLADDPELTQEHQAQIQRALIRIDELGQSLTVVVDRLPATVEKSIQPVVQAGNDLSSQIKHIVVITAAALILIILAALAAVYYFVLAPGTRSVVKTATLLNELADTLRTTAEIVETSSERNLQVMEEVRALREGQ